MANNLLGIALHQSPTETAPAMRTDHHQINIADVGVFCLMITNTTMTLCDQ